VKLLKKATAKSPTISGFGKPKVIFLVGPTAVGKTAVSIELAKMANAEIVSCDSMQIYRRMDILTSKPSASLRKRIPHYLVDLVSPAQDFDVSRYRREAASKIKDIISRGKTALLVGGAGLYMSMLIDGIFQVKSQNMKLREKLYKEAQALGSQRLYARLKEVDPQAASKIHPNDKKRIIRALEVFGCTGKPISQLQKLRKGLASEYDINIFCLNMERDKLYERIDRRVDDMFRQGLVKEVEGLLKLKLSRTASYAIGIRELKGYFDGGYNLEEARRLIKRNSRLYAKRQLTWFRKDKRIKWLEIGERDSPKTVAGKMLKVFDS
jgi:tRNA dimethylallyltransferase